MQRRYVAMIVGLMVFAVVLVAFTVSSKKIDDETIGLPATWTATVPSHGELWENAEINLNEGGKALLTAVPAGEISRRRTHLLEAVGQALLRRGGVGNGG